MPVISCWKTRGALESAFGNLETEFWEEAPGSVGFTLR